MRVSWTDPEARADRPGSFGRVPTAARRAQQTEVKLHASARERDADAAADRAFLHGSAGEGERECAPAPAEAERHGTAAKAGTGHVAADADVPPVVDVAVGRDAVRVAPLVPGGARCERRTAQAEIGERNAEMIRHRPRSDHGVARIIDAERAAMPVADAEAAEFRPHGLRTH